MVKKLKKGTVLTQDQLKTDVQMGEAFETYQAEGDKQPAYILTIKGNKYLVKRTGKCEPKKCKAACCKIMAHKTEGDLYFSGFVDEQIGDWSIIKKQCQQLSKGGMCKVWKQKKKFPKPCEQFPHPTDGVYVAVEPVCSFKFVILEVIEDGKKA